MYQINEKYPNSTEENFQHLVDALEDCFVPLKEDSIELDLKKFYTPNWACIWNKISNVGKKCVILEKNSKVALVLFEGEEPNEALGDNILSNLYRIEDLNLFGNYPFPLPLPSNEGSSDEVH